MTTARIELPPKLIPVFSGEADVRGAYGGRGSGKTRSFAKMSAVRAYMWAAAGRNGQVLCGRQFMKTLADSSLEEVKQAILETDWLKPFFDIGETFIRTIGLPGEVYYTFMGLDRNIDSVKSQARILLAWVDEAEPVTEEAWAKLIPTLREEDSELWVTWNPERKNSATHKRFRGTTDERMKVVELNWRDNPRFPAILERKRLQDQQARPDSYDHIWEGDFVTAVEGAYYAAHLSVARQEKRIGRVARDPLISLRAFWDLGGRGAKSDATAIWIAQFVGREVRVLDYYEAVGQPLAAHLDWLRSNGYTEGKVSMWLPHDGAPINPVADASWQTALEDAGYDVTVIPNQGAGAARMRIEAGRRLFPAIWFNEEKCRGGLDALGWYHEKKDEDRGIGLGPAHDWSSHAADAFGLMCICYEQPETPAQRKRYAGRSGGGASAWAS